MKNELEKTTRHNLILMAKLKAQYAEHYIDRCIESAIGISSRTMTKRKIIEYLNNQIDITELKEYTSPLYYDNLKSLRNVNGAFRIVDNHIIAQHGNVDLKKKAKTPYLHILSYEININDGDIAVIVYSPIKDYDGLSVIDHDVIFFNMNWVIRQLNKDDIQFSIIAKTDVKNIMNKKTNHILINDIDLIVYEGSTGYIEQIGNTEKYFYIRMPNKYLYKSLRNMSIINLGGFILCAFFILVLTNLVTVQNAENLLYQTAGMSFYYYLKIAIKPQQR